MKKILAVADLHCGSRLGLTPATWIPPDVTYSQAPLWNWWVTTLRDIGPVDGCVVNGDVVDGEGRREDLEQLTTDTKRQGEIALECLAQVQTKKWWFTYGTPYHTVGTYSYEEPVAEALGASIRDTQLIGAEGVRMSFRHAAGRSDTAYCQGTQTFKEAIREMLRAQQEERQDAQLVVRHHVHYYWKDENSMRTAVLGPCLQTPVSVYGRKVRSFYYTMGLLLISLDKGEFDVKLHELKLKVVHKQEYEWLK